MAPAATVTRPALAPDRWLLWLVLMLPLAWMTWRYAAESVFYGEYLHWTGVQSARLLLLTLAVTPLLRLLPRAAAIRWLRAHADEFRIDPERIGIWGWSGGGSTTLTYDLTRTNLDVSNSSVQGWVLTPRVGLTFGGAAVWSGTGVEQQGQPFERGIILFATKSQFGVVETCVIVI